MPSGIDYGNKHIVGGLLNKRLYDFPNDGIFIDNVIRLIKENQEEELERQTTLDGLGSDPLLVIPDNRFHINDDQADYNALACHVLYSARYQKSAQTVSTILDCSLLVTLEDGRDPDEVRRRSNSYSTAFMAILWTFFQRAPIELVYTGKVENVPQFLDIPPTAEILESGLAKGSNLSQKPIGLLKTLNFRINYLPNYIG